MKKRSIPKTTKAAQWEMQNLPLLAGFVLIVSCFILALTTLSSVKPETVLVTPQNSVNPEPSPICTQSSEIFSGIGARLEQVDVKVYIKEIIPGSPAEKNGIMPGDVIYRVDSTPVVDVDEAVSKIRGEVDVPVRLVLYRGNLRLDKTIVRENITDEKCN